MHFISLNLDSVSNHRWHIHVFELYERDKFIQITKPRPETRAVDGFEIILAVDGPIMKDIRVIGVFQAFVYLVAFVIALLSGQPRSQERCGILGSIVTSCCITIMKMPNSLWGTAKTEFFNACMWSVDGIFYDYSAVPVPSKKQFHFAWHCICISKIQPVGD